MEQPLVDVQDVEDVRMVFHVKDYDERMEKKRQYLIRMGEAPYSAYEGILADVNADPMEISGVFGVIGEVKGDRHRFIKHAMARLTDRHGRVRYSAVVLLGRIGSVAEASPVIALLSDEDNMVVHYAAKTLVAIGGPNEVVAMDVWLRGVTYREDRQLREHVQKCRDALKKRLEEAHAKDSSK